MQTVTLPSRLIEQAKTATGLRSARAALVRAVERLVNETGGEYQPGPELTKKLLAQKNKKGREYNTLEEMYADIDRNGA